MDTTIIIPFYGDDEWREKVMWWVHAYYLAQGFEVEIGVSSRRSKAEAVNNGVSFATGDKLAIIDADTVITAKQLSQGLLQGEWVVPYNRCLNLTQEATEGLLDYEDLPFDLLPIEGERHKHNYAGGVNIISRRLFDEVGGFDPRYEGWGGEDESFGRAVDTMFQPAVFVPGDVYHLWHVEDDTKKQFNQRVNLQMWKRYRWATGRQDRMRKVLERG